MNWGQGWDTENTEDTELGQEVKSERQEQIDRERLVFHPLLEFFPCPPCGPCPIKIIDLELPTRRYDRESNSSVVTWALSLR